MKKQSVILILYLVSVFLTSCTQAGNSSNAGKLGGKNGNLQTDTAGKTIESRFSTPADYERQLYDKNSFQYYLSHFPLKADGAKVYYYNGDVKQNDNIYAAVLDIDVGKRDLQQCADAVMRLRAEYLYGQKKYDMIHFNFTSGFRADYTKWAEGNRIKVSGNNVSWYKSKGKDYSYNTFKSYMEIVFTYAGTLSLSKELKSVPLDSIQIGDVFIKGGSPGHAVIVVDVAVNKNNGKKIFMIAQSYMPAQSIHLLVNPGDEKLSPWYDLSASDILYTPEWSFEKTALKRFQE